MLRTTERDLEKGAVYASITNHSSPIWGMSVKTAQAIAGTQAKEVGIKYFLCRFVLGSFTLEEARQSVVLIKTPVENLAIR